MSSAYTSPSYRPPGPELRPRCLFPRRGLHGGGPAAKEASYPPRPGRAPTGAPLRLRGAEPPAPPSARPRRLRAERARRHFRQGVRFRVIAPSSLSQVSAASPAGPEAARPDEAGGARKCPRGFRGGTWGDLPLPRVCAAAGLVRRAPRRGRGGARARSWQQGRGGAGPPPHSLGRGDVVGGQREVLHAPAGTCRPARSPARAGATTSHRWVCSTTLRHPSGAVLSSARPERDRVRLPLPVSAGQILENKKYTKSSAFISLVAPPCAAGPPPAAVCFALGAAASSPRCFRCSVVGRASGKRCRGAVF